MAETMSEKFKHSEVLPSRYTPEQARRVKAASVLVGGSVSAFIRDATVVAAQQRLVEASAGGPDMNLHKPAR